MADIPDDLIRLHNYEELLRSQALALIEGDDALGRHLEVVHDVMNHLMILAKLPSSSGTDLETLQLLGIRVLNFISAGLKAGLSGYFQVAFSVLRETLETANLIDLFLIRPELVAVWKAGDEKNGRELFSPVKVRMNLSGHANYKGQDRQPRYRLLSNYASHPSYAGFKLLQNGTCYEVGPFMALRPLKALLEDMGPLGGHAALNLSIAIDSDDPKALTATSDYMQRLRSYWDWTKTQNNGFT